MSNASFLVQSKMELYVDSLEKSGHEVHWPMRDTEQDDPTGGYDIRRTNFMAMIDADEVHIWYDENSGGSEFDMGGLFMLVEVLGWRGKKIVIANRDELADNKARSFLKVFQRIAG